MYAFVYTYICMYICNYGYLLVFIFDYMYRGV